MYELLLSDARVYAQVLLAWTVCLAALVWGGGPERAVAATWLIVFELGGRVLSSLLGVRFQLMSIDLWLVTSDFVAGALLIAVALHANRNYTLWIAAMQLLAMTAHVARGLVESIAPVAYVVMVAAPGWLQLLFLAGGLARHVRRERKFGSYRDWRFSREGMLQPMNDSWRNGPQPSWRDDLK